MRWKLIISGLLILVLLTAASLVSARLAGYSLPWWTVDSGGGSAMTGGGSGGKYSLNGTIGQPDAGVLSGGKYVLYGGFWGPAAPPGVYLPLIQR